MPLQVRARTMVRMADSAQQPLKMSSSVLIAAGAVTLIIGLVAIFFPDVTLLALAILAGLNLFVLGIVAVIEGFGARGEGSRVLSIVLGLLAVVAGLIL